MHHLSLLPPDTQPHRTCASLRLLAADGRTLFSCHRVEATDQMIGRLMRHRYPLPPASIETNGGSRWTVLPRTGGALTSGEYRRLYVDAPYWYTVRPTAWYTRLSDGLLTARGDVRHRLPAVGGRPDCVYLVDQPSLGILIDTYRLARSPHLVLRADLRQIPASRILPDETAFTPRTGSETPQQYQLPPLSGYPSTAAWAEAINLGSQPAAPGDASLVAQLAGQGRLAIRGPVPVTVASTPRGASV